MSLTNSWLNSHVNKPVDKSYMKADRDGLSVRVSVKGTLTFTMRYRHNNKPDQMALGTYPQMTLAEAREANQKYRKVLSEGTNPKEYKAKEQAGVLEAISFQDLFGEWFKRKIEGEFGQKRESMRRRMFENDVFPTFGKRAAKDITIHEWLRLIEKVQERAPTTAEYILIITKQIYHFAVIRELVPVNPLQNLSATRDLNIKRNVGERYLENHELHMVMNVIENAKMSRPYKLFTWICLFYGCRPGELRLAKKTDFDFENGIWTVPWENHKIGKNTKKPLLRPIVPEIKPMLNELFETSVSDWVISTTRENPSIGKKKGEPLKETFYTRIANDLTKLVKKEYGEDLEKWTFYALRKTMRTNVGRIGEETQERTAPYFVREIMIGHKLPGQWSVYDKHSYLDAQAQAYSAWWSRLISIKEGADNVRVVNFR